MTKVRVRFAPSPTGPLHIGGVRTALFNYLFAKKHEGDFILRIEDTDQNRYVKGAEEYIIEALHWCGILPDEGVGKGGKHAPYRQSERKDIYKKYALQLIEAGNAYYAFDTPEELEAMRERQKQDGSSNQQYNAETRKEMKNSLTLTPLEVGEKLDKKEPFVIRLKLPEEETVSFTDIVNGHIAFHTSQLDDKILFKSDGMPTYHLANVVDDHLMQISHVIRGTEWINSTPVHILLYKYLGWEGSMPVFAHMPLTLKPDGKGKLSKRDGDRLGFPVFPLQWINPQTQEVSSGYRESGYFPEAFINILAFLGWNPGTNQEIFSMEELIEAFSLERVGKSGSRFDPEKAKWFNHQYLQNKSDEALAQLYAPILREKNISANQAYIKQVVQLIKERANFIQDFWNLSHYFFETPESYDKKIIAERWTEDMPQILNHLLKPLSSTENFQAEHLEKIIKQFISDNNFNTGKVLNCLRLCIVGSASGPSLYDIISLIGKEEALRRIQRGIDKIKLQKK